ncbi:DUF2798 domain-containing protein [Vibrio sp.]|uniref:DUF2798 domain-containing protein n=1 Tax=Vibrio viridaestus TaxID=2487322 RepID=A0A3N9TH44_9VIBR|nr:DUF2798 domain-containing protein [Vibrio viridaestus]MDC0610758.1 DUF2798 domain-containing protein [Vibrio sp.]RQW63618.1 DUF2798 domain-containing protein [Vibrio viridaestus]
MKLKKIAITLPAPIFIVASITLFMTFINHGFTSQFMNQWLISLAFSLIIMLPLAGLLIMKISMLVETKLSNIKPLYQKLIQCFFVALCLESVLSIINTATTVNTQGIQEFVWVWALTLIKAMPLGYAIAMMMIFIVKPRIQRALANA